MAASEAVIAFEVTLEVETSAGSGIYTELAEVVDVNPPNASVEDVDVTHMKSPGRAREFKPGLTDYGETSFTLNWIPGSTTDDTILDWRAGGDTRSTRLKYYDNAGALIATQTFPAYPRGYQTSAAIGDKMAATLTLKVAGEVVQS